MDLKAFTEDEFNYKEWINEFLNSLPAETPTGEKDSIQVVSSTVLRLQAAFHETDVEIKTVADELPLLLPRTLQDLDLLSKDLILLKDQMNTVGHDIRAAEKQSTEAMKTLFTLETIKQRMLLTEKALKETDNWISLTSDVEDLCEAGDSEKLSDRLIKLHKCLALLAPGLSADAVAERRGVLSSLADKYEAIVSPALVKAFNDLDRDTVAKFVEVFILIGRTEQLESYYWRSRVDKYASHWEKLLERHGSEKLCYALSEFYVDLTRSWQQEVQWCSLLFDQPAILSCRVLVELSKKLESTFCTMLTSKLKDNETAIQTLIEFKHACDDFTESVTTSGYLPPHSDLPKQLFRLVYQPLVRCFDQFQPLFEKEFRSTLDTTILDHVEIAQCVQLLTRSEERIFEQGHTVKDNCDRLLDGFIAPVFVPAYETFLTEYFSEVKRVANNLRERVFSKVMSDEGISSDHWSVVNHCIQMLVIVGKCSQQLTARADELCADISSTSAAFLESNRTTAAPPAENLLPPFVDYLMQDCPKFRQIYRSFINAMKSEDKVKAVLGKGLVGVSQLATVVSTFTLDVLTKPAFADLEALVSEQGDEHTQIHAAIVSDSMPDYSFAPKHQIAELGQYLLTLPHHLDTFGSGNERMLAETLRLCSHPAIVFEKQQLVRVSTTSSSSEQDYCQASELLLEPVGKMITDEIIRLLKGSNFKHTNVTAKQLATDIDYLLGVFDDLGQMPPASVKLKQLAGALRSGSLSANDETINPEIVKLAKQILPPS